MKGQLNIFDEILVDNFAGGGGASTGIELATGKPITIAINHDPASIQMHIKNHPYTRHYCEDVYEIDPLEVTQGQKVALCWLSPDCKHFSKAKGGKPVDKKIRGLAWVALKWAAKVRPRVIILENVEEFKTWGPLRTIRDPKTKRCLVQIKDKKLRVADVGEVIPNSLLLKEPNPKRKGETFTKFKKQLEELGYLVEYKELKACDYGAPTIRKRFFLIARCDGKPIVFPKPTHGNGKELKPYRTAAEIIDWSIPTKSIFERKKSLADNTLRRIAKGIDKFVLNNPDPLINKYESKIETPLIISLGHTSQKNRSAAIEEPLRTIVGKAEHCLVTPYLIQYHSEVKKNDIRGQKVTQPLYTLDTNPRISPYNPENSTQQINFLSEYYGNGSAVKINRPLNTITTKDRNSLVEIKIEKIKNVLNFKKWDKVRNLLNDYCDYHLKDNEIIILTINGIDYFISDIRLRMLVPRELYKAQGFPDDYVIDFDVNGKKYSKKEQVARCGNSVPPPFAEALVRANLPELCIRKIETMKELKKVMVC